VIVRAFHATATPEGADAYQQHFTRSALPHLQRIDGYQGAYLLRRDHDRHVELQVFTCGSRWRRSAGSPDRTWSTPWSNLPPRPPWPATTPPSPTTPSSSTPSVPAPASAGEAAAAAPSTQTRPRTGRGNGCHLSTACWSDRLCCVSREVVRTLTLWP